MQTKLGTLPGVISVACCLLLVGGCGSGGETATDAAALTCNGQAASCASTPYGTCVEVRMGPGRCLDWSKGGATRCEAGADSCPTTVPAGMFGNWETTKGIVACVTESGTLQFAGALAPPSPMPGYCVGSQAATDSTGVATCEPNPCGLNGFCSYLKNQLGQSIVTCTWPI